MNKRTETHTRHLPTVLLGWILIYIIYRSTSYNPTYKQCTEHLVVG